MGYEGHVVLEPDVSGAATALAAEAMDYLAHYVQALEADGHEIEIVSAGGTNTYDMTGVHPRVTELAGGDLRRRGSHATRAWRRPFARR